MRLGFAAVATLAAGLTLSACAETTHLTRSRRMSAGDGMPFGTFIDAKQRAVITTLPQAKWEYPADGGKPRFSPGKARVCAEPSPDALSALAASQGFGVTKGTDLGANAALSLSESAASIGLRTQSIQLMRDSMYRICEGYMSGALTDGAFETLHRRLQSSMVAILAIEQLTGAVKAQQVVLGGSASTGSADAVLKLTTQTADARTAVGAAETKVATATEAKTQAETAAETAKTAADAAPDDKDLAKKAADAQEKLKAATKAVTDAQAAQEEAEAAFKSVDEGRRAALSGTTSASSHGEFAAVSGGAPIGTGAAEAVAEAVQGIVHDTLDLQYSSELCTTLMVGVAYDNELSKQANSPIIAKCASLLEEAVKAVASDTHMAELNAQAYRDALAKLAADPHAKIPTPPPRPKPPFRN